MHNRRKGLKIMIITKQTNKQHPLTPPKKITKTKTSRNIIMIMIIFISINNIIALGGEMYNKI